jgi:di/tricarboxylate transporter
MAMNFDQLFLFGLLLGIFGMLIWGRFRYDAVAFSALIIAYIGGVIPKEEVFSGFGHPATIIVALVLIVSRGLSNSGAVELLTRYLVSASRGPGLHIAIMSSIASALSALMNNVAALALLMPVDMQAASKAKRSPAVTLMPLSFATILGGMVTLIGTPPNIVIATFREQALGEPYRMFDFAPVGLIVASIGILFVALIGWRLIPIERHKHDTREELLDLEGYIAEARVPEGCKAIGETLRQLYPVAEENDVSVIGVIRRGKRLPGTAVNERLRKSDTLVLEGGPDAIEQFVGAAGLKYIGSEKHDSLGSETLALAEVVVPAGSLIEGRSALEVRLLYRHGVTLLGVSRRGRRFREQVRKLQIRAGDILLLLGPEDQLPDVIGWLGALPLAKRGLLVTQRHKAGLAVGIFGVAIVAASLDWIYLPVALAAVAVAYIGLRIISPQQIYRSVEWPVIVLLGSLIPIGAALESSGGTALIADAIVRWTVDYSPVVVLTILMIVTMTLSDVLNNVATALIAAPIGVDIAAQLGVNPDPFLMAVAVAASCAFLTPIGHKNNTIIMGPGGYRFGDYWRMGLPLEIIVVAVGVPMILFVWPL